MNVILLILFLFMFLPLFIIVILSYKLGRKKINKNTKKEIIYELFKNGVIDHETFRKMNDDEK
jgi:uncharacterized membrane protein